MLDGCVNLSTFTSSPKKGKATHCSYRYMLQAAKSTQPAAVIVHIMFVVPQTMYF